MTEGAVMPIEWGKVREYALATGISDPGYLADPRAVVPPTFLASVIWWDPSLPQLLTRPEVLAACVKCGIEPNVTRLLSLGQEYRYPDEPPRVGELLTVTPRLDEVDGDRAAGQVRFRFALEFRNEVGTLRAEVRYTSAYRAASAARRMTPPRVVADGRLLPRRSFGVVTMSSIVRYQGASGDLNPMHHDDELARSAGFPAAFGVGMLNAGYLATYCTDLYGRDSVRRFAVRFRRLVWRGDRLVARGRVVREAGDGGVPTTGLELELRNQDDEVVVSGEADVLAS